MLLILFGLAGAGKNYVGQFLSQTTHLHFWDADEALTNEMRRCIQEKRSFTQDMLDSYMNRVIRQIKVLKKTHPNLIVSQAFYRNKNRALVLSTFPESVFIQVTVADDILTKRLRHRHHGVNEAYAKKIHAEFEPPNHIYYQINNDIDNGRDELLAQLMNIPVVAKLLTSLST